MARGGFRGKSQFDRMIDDYGFGGSVKKVSFLNLVKLAKRSEAKKREAKLRVKNLN